MAWIFCLALHHCHSHQLNTKLSSTASLWPKSSQSLGFIHTVSFSWFHSKFHAKHSIPQSWISLHLFCLEMDDSKWSHVITDVDLNPWVFADQWWQCVQWQHHVMWHSVFWQGLMNFWQIILRIQLQWVCFCCRMQSHCFVKCLAWKQHENWWTKTLLFSINVGLSPKKILQMFCWSCTCLLLKVNPKRTLNPKGKNDTGFDSLGCHCGGRVNAWWNTGAGRNLARRWQLFQKLCLVVTRLLSGTSGLIWRRQILKCGIQNDCCIVGLRNLGWLPGYFFEWVKVTGY